MRASTLGLAALLFVSLSTVAHQPAGMRGSIVEDRAARKLLEAGFARYDGDEVARRSKSGSRSSSDIPAAESVLQLHMLLGETTWKETGSYDRAADPLRGCRIRGELATRSSGPRRC